MIRPNRILLTGAGGFLGSHVLAALEQHGRSEIWSTRSATPHRITLDLATRGAAGDLVREIRPAAIIHAAAIPDITRCQREPELACRVNTEATAELAVAAKKIAARFVFLSTDQVHDGEHAPYADAAPPSPLNAYGRTKALAEEAVRGCCSDHLILRLALCYGVSPTGRRSASEVVLRALEEGRPLGLFSDEIRTPVPARYVGEAVAVLLDHDFTGTLNLGGRDHLSRHAFGLAVCRAHGLEPTGIRAVCAADLELSTPRPRDLSLETATAHELVGHAPGPLDEELAQLTG